MKGRRKSPDDAEWKDLFGEYFFSAIDFVQAGTELCWQCMAGKSLLHNGDPGHVGHFRCLMYALLLSHSRLRLIPLLKLSSLSSS